MIMTIGRLPMVRAWSLGCGDLSFLWYAFGVLEQKQHCPQFGRRTCYFASVWLVEQGLEHRATFTSWISCMLFCTFAFISFFWRAHRTGRARAAELVELQKLCDASSASRRMTRTKFGNFDRRILFFHRRMLFFKCSTTNKIRRFLKRFALRSAASVFIIRRAAPYINQLFVQAILAKSALASLPPTYIKLLLLGTTMVDYASLACSRCFLSWMLSL